MKFSVPSRRLPVVRVFGVRYVIDLRRRQLRRLKQPWRVIPFEKEEAGLDE
jgi:hypothetical protein